MPLFGKKKKEEKAAKKAIETNVGNVDDRMPAEELLNQLFQAMLEELAIPPEERESMMRLELEKKWKLIRSHNAKATKTKAASQIASSPGGGKKIRDTPQYFIEALKAEPSLKLVNELRITLGSQPIRWLKQFCELKGMQVLVDIADNNERKTERKESDYQLVSAILRCIKLIFNSKIGIESAITLPNAIKKLSLIVDNPVAKIKIGALELLAAVCLFSSKGHQQVLLGMTNLKEVTREKVRFERLIAVVSQESDLEVTTAIMVLINALINAISDLEDRVSLRNEFAVLGLPSIIKGLKDSSPDLDTQIDLFEEEARIDEEEMGDKFVNADVDISDPGSIVKRIATELNDTPEYAKFISLMQHLLTIVLKRQKDNEICLKSFILVDKFAKKLSMQKKDVSFDYEAKINFTDLISSANESAKVALLQKELADLKKVADQNKVLKDELQELRAGKYGNVPLIKTTELLRVPTNKETSIKEEILKKEEKIRGLSPNPSESSIVGIPPPPPFSGGPPPPPPPGGGLSLASRSSIPPHLKGLSNPSQKMKNLNWVKIPHLKVEGTIWGSQQVKTLMDLPFKEIEQLFSTVALEKKKAVSKEGEKKKEKKVVTVIDGKRAQNLGILLSSSKISNEVARDAIIALDDKILQPNTVKSLADLCPSQEDVWPIPKLKERLTCWVHREKFQNKILEIKKDIKVLVTVTEQLKSNPKILNLLEIVLTIGNFLNGGTFKGGAWGFKTESLLRLSDIRANGGKTTMLHYIAKIIDEKYTELKTISTELPNLHEASRVSFPQLLTDISQLKTELTFVQEVVEEYQTENSVDKFEPIFGEFVNEARLELLETIDRMEYMKANFTEVLALFGEDSKTLPEELFSTWFKFFFNLDRAMKDNEREKATAEKNAKRLAAKEKRLQDIEKKKQGGEGLMDDILNKLRDGDMRARRDEEDNESENSDKTKEDEAEETDRDSKPSISESPRLETEKEESATSTL